jgi:hypothetical protein
MSVGGSALLVSEGASVRLSLADVRADFERAGHELDALRAQIATIRAASDVLRAVLADQRERRARIAERWQRR